MGLFSKVGGATVNQGGVYFQPGKYAVKVGACKAVRSGQSGKDFFIVECEIVDSDVDTLPPGAHASQVIEVNHIMGPVNIKAFVSAASGVDPGAETAEALVEAAWNAAVPGSAPWTFEAVCEYVVSESNPLEDIDLNLECRTVQTKAKNDFTKHFWSPG